MIISGPYSLYTFAAYITLREICYEDDDIYVRFILLKDNSIVASNNRYMRMGRTL